ncbi:trypsin-like serine peptidase [Roseobacter ponti]|uniref:Trypsin-like serine protease n=1 Tax=Roseobacter ponti TaxID=1891787 RepID=A0A858SXF2_9RHOB|nr:trypsin-like serine protease [Roseobacter ponti]QJF51556.1 trypsin-like serine protease [Roseobacter ponti]
MHWFLVSVLAVFLFAGPQAAMAEGLEPVSAEDRRAWTAVGALRTQGIEAYSACTATLVAPDMIVTAAHCTVLATGFPGKMHFFAGRNGTRNVADSRSTTVIRHPLWEAASGSDRFRYDLAVVHLGRLVEDGKVTPMPVYRRGNAPAPRSVALLGYNERAGVLRGRFDCPLISDAIERVYVSGCTVVAGNSGGAVVVENENGWALAGVIVARSDNDGRAIAAPVDQWLLRQVDEARERQTRRTEGAD